MVPVAAVQWIFLARQIMAMQPYAFQIQPAGWINFVGPLVLLGIALGILIGYFLFRLLSTRGRWQPGIQVSRRKAERAEVNERERLHAIYHLISVLSASLNYERILDNILDLSANILGTPNGATDSLISSVLLFSKDQSNEAELTVGSARRFTPADTRIRLPGTRGMIGRAIDECEPTLTKNITQDPEISRIIALHACKVAYCFPLRSGLETYGVLLFAHPDEEYFNSERREVLEIIGTQAVIAIQNAGLYRDLLQEKERIQEIQEEARKKLARDLHDGPTQSVAAIAMRVNFARRLMDRDPKAGIEELYKVEDLARRTTKEIRHMLFTLRPLVLESQGLLAAFEAMAEKMHETYNQNVIVAVDPKAMPELEMGKQAVIFYIAEEAINNARKHAQAANIWLRLKMMEENLALLEIEDNGVGFNVGAVDAFYDQRGSLGLVNMRERAELINGHLQIDSSEGNGTRIRVLIPLSEDAADRLRSGQ
jgi:signal transduction histidine kinase